MVPSNKVIPSTRPRLAILDPMIFPKDKSGKPSNAAFILTISSGAEVAKDTTVIPMTILGICNLKDRATAAFSNQFPPNINATKPKKIYKASNIVLIWSKYNKAPPKVLKKNSKPR